MDFFTQKELDGLKSDIKSSEIALEAEKCSFEKKLKDSIGPQMIEELNAQKTDIKKEQNTKKRKFNFLKIFNLYK